MKMACTWRLLILPMVAATLALAAIASAKNQPLPAPQIANAEGGMAPDFTLKDQDGKDFRLADQRGSRVLVYFYRGYW